MSASGWYPDPAGAPGRYRYWDGANWSDATTTNPSQQPPPRMLPETGKKGGKGWIIALVAIALVTLLIVALVLRTTGRGPLGGGGGGATEDWNSSTPSVSAWDEVSTPTPPPTGGSIVACPVTQVRTTTKQGNDGLIRGGGLAFTPINGWIIEGLYLQWVSDFQGQVKTIYPGWMSNVGVGALNHVDGFTDPRLAATQTLECFASSGYYQYFTGREDLINEPYSIDGHQGWRIRANVYVDHPTLSQVKGDVVDIIVVDLGPGSTNLGLFVSSVTIDDDRVQPLVDRVIESLTVP